MNSTHVATGKYDGKAVYATVNNLNDFILAAPDADVFVYIEGSDVDDIANQISGPTLVKKSDVEWRVIRPIED